MRRAFVALALAATVARAEIAATDDTGVRRRFRHAGGAHCGPRRRGRLLVVGGAASSSGNADFRWP
jgi:hypothetical protein